jgi:hypothetical protein
MRGNGRAGGVNYSQSVWLKRTALVAGARTGLAVAAGGREEEDEEEEEGFLQLFSPGKGNEIVPVGIFDEYRIFDRKVVPAALISGEKGMTRERQAWSNIA